MVYVHVPFCRSFCVYCDFYSEIAPSGSDFGFFVDGVCREIESRKEEIERSSGVNTLYFGGGTPSVLGVPDIARIASAVSDKPFREFTVEVNPEDVVVKGPEYVEGLLEAGVNRISMGVQSLDDGVLKWMGRRHDSARAREAFRILRDAGCDNISLDLIFGIGYVGVILICHPGRNHRDEAGAYFRVSVELGGWEPAGGDAGGRQV